MVVSASRAAENPEQVPFSLTRLEGATVRTAPTVALDDALRSVPGFSLFRRSGSLSANPTAQGVSLRGLGPSGASRSLVLLDGVPLNDPFGGWIAWAKVPREALSGVELVPGGGATAWGDAALGGVVQLFTESPGQNQSRLAAATGSFATHTAEFEFTQSGGRGTLQLLGRDFATGGFSPVAPGDRGPIDVAAWNRHHWLTGRWRQPVGANAEVIVTARTFAERRGNGTPYQRNSSRENFGSVVLNARPDKNFVWTATAYAQDQSFASTFSAVNATRTGETPASDQFAVPAVALGAAWTGTWTQPDNAHTTAGVDARHVRGETRENYFYTNGDFTRRRIAGGTQDFAGVFALHERPLAADWRATFGARLNYWRETDGHRRETDRGTAATLRDDHYSGRDGVEFNPSAGLVWRPVSAWRLRVAAQQAARRPTLNELYRPFRVGSVVTEANPALKTEHATSAELGAEYSPGAVTLGAAVFWTELHDAVGNVTLARGPGTFPLFGFIPAGGVGRQRLNLDRVMVRGMQLSAKWQATTALTLSADCLYDDATVRRATLAPSLAGRRLAQVPRNTAVLGASWRAPGRLTFTARVRWFDRQFEDDENQLVLGAAFVADLGAGWAFAPWGEIFLTVENAGDTRVETGRSADGIVNTGSPRLVLGGVRCAW
jgi:outer membrane receptor protein involved in Fe transport